MGNVLDGDVLRITTVLSYGEEDIQNTYHLKYAGATDSDASVKTSTALFFNTIYGVLLSYISSVISFDYLDFYNITQGRPMGQEPWTSLTAGTSVEDVPVLQAAPLVLFDTGVKKSQGRKYTWPPGESLLNNGGQLASGLVSVLTTWAANFIGTKAIGIGTGQFGNWAPLISRFAAWISATVNDDVKTQRRRSLGTGI